ncbi:peptidyl-prolyl cis-trans isomerase [Wallemia mellicola CBS 633.66]|uniref:peptidylprolyl isomerase n=1 Tax=Wallemia mellicola (strain ATCC MYA-4683 / CBS 633.66) TaxID=671144 RepID=I4YJD6_WALMC|nr:peptidyl-prolyl cis-trans isomerase [Wallemia mellicola CBS 633.66]EIM24078.1 peptidyl-prolyl cis-trans isomerase [Wallemia mellicola CBS 633.66]|eukprot:XP_006955905.1 peptidyl-prolyl cis-trans isomerase [Wallemia mellicola CBS 633.66]
MPATLETIRPGDGVNKPQPGNTITMHYHGTLEDGSVFDSSYRRGQPFSSPIGVGRLIKAWDQCVPQMTKGEKAIITATHDVAYGETGFPPVIPARATLKFEVELIDFK